MIIDCYEKTITIDIDDRKWKDNSYEYGNAELYWMWANREEAIEEFKKWVERYIKTLEKLLLC